MKKVAALFVSFALLFLNGCKDNEDKPLTYLDVSIDTITDIPEEGDQFQVIVTSSSEWQASASDDWIQLTPQSGYFTVSGQRLYVTILPNSKTAERNGTITIVNSHGNNPISVLVSQYAHVIIPALTVTPASIENVPSDGDASKSFKLTSNYPWSAEPNVPWIEMIDAEGEGSEDEQIVRFKVLPSDETQLREGRITVNNGHLTRYVAVTQSEYVDPNAGDFYAVDLSTLTFADSYIYYIQVNSSNVAMITKEYLGQVTNQQAVMVYSLSGGVPDVNKVLAAKVTLVHSGGDSYIPPVGNLHGGTYSFFTGGYIEPGNSPEVDMVYIRINGNTVEWLTELPSGKSASGQTPVAYTLKIDGYDHKLVKVGNQYWTAENVRSSITGQGTAITGIITDTFSTQQNAVWNADSPVYALHSEWGYIYNWYAAVMLAPEGWRTATAPDSASDWGKLVDFVGTSPKKYATESQGGSNVSLFSVAHSSRVNSGGGYAANDPMFWSATQSSATNGLFLRIRGSDATVAIGTASNTSKRLGAGVRLVKE